MVYSLPIIKGRNLLGKIGLFPQSYTAPAPLSNGAPAIPTTSSPDDANATTTDNGVRTILQPLNEESETETPPEHVSNIVAPVPQGLPNSTFLNGKGGEDGDEGKSVPGAHQRVISNGSEEMMKATITDVQKAIEQLGRGHGPNEDGDGDGGRSFSFASSRDVETDTDYDMSDVDGPDADGGQGWHKGARRKLAAKARKAVEEAEKLEAMIGGAGIMEAERRIAVPPIEVEVSDESEDDDGDFTSHSSVYRREHPHITEEDDEEAAPIQPRNESSIEHDTPKRGSAGTQSGHEFTLTHRDSSSEGQLVTATRSSFPAIPSPALPFSAASTIQTPEPVPTERVISSVSPRLVASRSISPAPLDPAISSTFPEPTRSIASSPLREPVMGLPSPTGSFQWISANPTGVLSKHSSVSSSKSPTPASALSQPPVTASSMQPTLVEEKRGKADPGEWSVDDVVDWLKGKGFDKEVQDKFIGAWKSQY
jgi:hypothetical protein